MQADTLPPLPAAGEQVDGESAADSYAASSSRQPERWPSRGHVRFRGVSLRYSEQGAYALMDVHLDIQPGEKIGVVGVQVSLEESFSCFVIIYWVCSNSFSLCACPPLVALSSCRYLQSTFCWQVSTPCAITREPNLQGNLNPCACRRRQEQPDQCAAPAERGLFWDPPR